MMGRSAVSAAALARAAAGIRRSGTVFCPTLARTGTSASGVAEGMPLHPPQGLRPRGPPVAGPLSGLRGSPTGNPVVDALIVDPVVPVSFDYLRLRLNRSRLDRNDRRRAGPAQPDRPRENLKKS